MVVLCCRQTEPQAAPLSADAIREAEDSSPPPEPAHQEMPQDAQPAPSTSAMRQEAEQTVPRVPLRDSHQSQHPANSGVIHVPQEDVSLPSAAPSQSAAAAETAAAASIAAAAVDDASGGHVAASTGESRVAAAHAPSTKPQSQPSAAATPEQGGHGSASSATPGSSAAVAIDALPAAKTLPEQDKPVPLTPRTPRGDKGNAQLVEWLSPRPFEAEVSKLSDTLRTTHMLLWC